MSKSPAGTPQVKLSNGKLQIVLTYGGKRKYLSLGLSESKQNRDYADMVRSWIQKDLRYNNFDPSLDRYRRVPDRKYRWDFVHRPSKVAITSRRGSTNEINGDIWVKSGHSSGTGLLRAIP
jgi:Arm DNA-binding domain